MDGVVNVYKESGPTSHDIVNEVRKILHIKRVGHAGTLDPMASGVLVVCVGRGTRIVEYLTGTSKQYRARMALGIRTDSQDTTGSIIEENNAAGVNKEDIERVIESFVGDIEQVPPMVSAIKHQGRRLYDLARKGITVDRKTRPVSIYGLKLLEWIPGERAEARILVDCSSGTYIRTLCADIGDALGCGACMSSLERTRVGNFELKDSVTISDLRNSVQGGDADKYTVDMGSAIAFMHEAVISDESVVRLSQGNIVDACSKAGNGEVVRVIDAGGRLIAIGSIISENGVVAVRPKKVLIDI